ncbi:FecR domain-containing protein [Methylobacillus gramineus]|uniref:FecR domain-containing protein n=1 Tax=Methylobacillus gramineus TaxID=755169 RepID=UPI001CFFFCFA|nr:FecR domain-containing protein [Methylobacillus gramineus]MCB5184255.1 FecR domain-containing protein [Methylobacillus gramineus]
MQTNKQESPRPDQGIVEQAIFWLVKLQSGTASQEEHAACERWKMQHPQHQLVWDRLNIVGQQVQQIPANAAHAALGNEHLIRQKTNVLMRRRQALKFIAIGMMTAGVAGSGYEWLPWRPMLAEYTTRVGERKQVMLADGSSVMLNTSSAMDVQYADNLRQLALHQGEALITTAHDPAVHQRPFVLATTHGSLQALGTKFLVRQQHANTLVSVLEGAVEVTAGSARQILKAGEQLLFSEHEIGPIAALNPDILSWINGVIVARHMRLVDFIAELDRYRRGRLYCDNAVAELRISGVFPIDQPHKVLQALTETLPINVETRWGLWVTVKAQA